MRLIKKVSFVIIGLIIAVFISICIAFGILSYKTKAILDNYSSVYDNPKYEQAILIDDVEVITQDVSCGYAVIEMFATWNGDVLTEEIFSLSLTAKFRHAPFLLPRDEGKEQIVTYEAVMPVRECKVHLIDLQPYSSAPC